MISLNDLNLTFNLKVKSSIQSQAVVNPHVHGIFLLKMRLFQIILCCYCTIKK